VKIQPADTTAKRQLLYTQLAWRKSYCIHHSYSLQRRLVSCKCQIPCNSYLISVLLRKYYLLSH